MRYPSHEMLCCVRYPSLRMLCCVALCTVCGRSLRFHMHLLLGAGAGVQCKNLWLWCRCGFNFDDACGFGLDAGVLVMGVGRLQFNTLVEVG